MQPPLTTWWVLWAAFQAGIFMFYFVLGGAPPRTTPADPSFFWLAAVIPFAGSVVIRWGALPRVKRSPQAFQLFIVGISLAEVTCFLGLFIFPEAKLQLFSLSALGIFQYLPIFARRYSDPDGRNRGAR